MTFPDPSPGLVIRYSFLWKEDYNKGKYDASKDRPCAIVLAARMNDMTTVQVVVVPITHSAPDSAESSSSIEIPAAIAKALELGGIGCGSHS